MKPNKIPTAAALLTLLGRHTCTAESFGHKTFCYLQWHTNAEKLEKEAMLIAKGYAVDLEYGYQNPTKSSVRVSPIRKDYGSPFKVTLHWKVDLKTGNSIPSTRWTR